MHHVYGCRSSSQLATRLSSPIHRSHIESKPPNHRRQLLMEPSRDALGRRCPNHCTRMVPRQRTRPWPCRCPFWKRITKREAANNISMPAGTYGNFPGENGRVNYSEGLMVGYRYYTTRRIPTLFPSATASPTRRSLMPTSTPPLYLHPTSSSYPRHSIYRSTSPTPAPTLPTRPSNCTSLPPPRLSCFGTRWSCRGFRK